MPPKIDPVADSPTALVALNWHTTLVERFARHCPHQVYWCEHGGDYVNAPTVEGVNQRQHKQMPDQIIHPALFGE